MKSKILAIINEFDPQGLRRMGAPKDEYAAEAAAIASCVESDMTAEQILDIVHGMFVVMFNHELAGERKLFQPIADKIYEMSRGGGM